MSRARLLVGNVLDVLPTLPDGSVRCCVTSPPYWGLRDYGTAQWVGGDSACDHRSPTMRDGRNEDRATLGGGIMATNGAQLLLAARSNCGKCGARRIDRQLGLEPTPDAYVANMVAVFREVRRVLADDGTLWLNLGDSYAANRGGTAMPAETLAGGISGRGDIVAKRGRESGFTPHRDPASHGLKHKDLVGIPWRVAFALQADGWYLRSDLIWAKPNPMPESVTDRPTKAHEYLFLLAKSERYYYDAAAIAEPFADERMGNPGSYQTDRYNRPEIVASRRQYHGRPFNADGAVPGRNARTVWTITTQPYPEAHFATFPEELPRRCILAGSAPGDTVLDPFAGSGTTLAVAIGNGRHGIGVELNPAYAEMAQRRIGPMFCEVSA